ncbi:SDR family oxidoreductase [Planctomicrobium sp. SH664]|uniref:SDR family oxidoreductase n=1 Tax=Planctomicrobium sp. SH664 TaxID=3448125 RepID=UPI003F5C33C2
MTTQRTQPKPPFPKQGLKEPGIEQEMSPRPHFEAPRYQAAGKLKGKVALITGGDSGIGRAVAFLYAREGADVALVYLPEEQVDADFIAQKITELGRKVVLIPGDVCDPEFCEQAVQRTVDELGQLDILVNNAAYQKHRKSLDEIDLEQWDRTFKTNIYGYFHMTKAALPFLRKRSSIINTGSITGIEGNKELLDYSSTKGAIHAFTKSLAQNLVEKGIRVNGIAPGPIWTPLNPAETRDQKTRDFGAETPLGRPGQPEEMAPAYVFFASDADSSYITGHVLPLLGGETIGA